MLLSLVSSGYCQLPDSLKIYIGSIGTVAKDGYQPLWLVSNRWGAITDQGHDASTYAGFTDIHWIGKRRSTSSDSVALMKPAPFYVRYGLNLINNNHFQDVIFQEGYLKAGFKNLEIRYGRFKDIPGEVDKDLSTGSLGVSGNALPVPQIGIALTDYVNVPFTNGWLQVKGELSHGWLGRDRYLNSYYHEKNLYLRAGKRKFRFFVGAQHYVEWGGKRDGIQLDRSFKGFTNVLFATNNADDGSGFDPNSKTASYRAGDERGLVELGFDLETAKQFIHFYHQTPFDGTWGVNIKNIDNLSGISIAPKNANAMVKKVLLEFIYTKQAENYAPASARQAYYNNGYYKTGWEYDNRIIGTPLFINRTRAQYYSYFQKRGIKPFDWNSPNLPGNSNIIYNQLVGLNIGLLLRFSNKLSGKTMLTYTNGQYQDNGPNLGQYYTLQELYYSFSKSLKISAGFALDAGNFTNNVGGSVGAHWQFKKG